MAQVMPLPDVDSPNTFTKRTWPSGLQHAPASSESLRTLTANSKGRTAPSSAKGAAVGPGLRGARAPGHAAGCPGALRGLAPEIPLARGTRRVYKMGGARFVPPGGRKVTRWGGRAPPRSGQRVGDGPVVRAADPVPFEFPFFSPRSPPGHQAVAFGQRASPSLRAARHVTATDEEVHRS